MMMVYVPLGKFSKKDAEADTESLAEDILENIEHIEFVEAAYGHTDVVDVH